MLLQQDAKDELSQLFDASVGITGETAHVMDECRAWHSCFTSDRAIGMASMQAQ